MSIVKLRAALSRRSSVGIAQVAGERGGQRAPRQRREPAGWSQHAERSGRAGPSEPGPSEQGFSLLELVVATLVLSVVLLFVAQGLLEAQRLFVDAQRSVTRGSTQLAFTFLRRDARSSRSVAHAAVAWGQRPLLLSLPDGSRVAYALADDRLERRVLDPGGRERSRQVVARNVLAFHWQRPAAGLLEATVVLRPPPPPPRVLDRSAIRPAEPSPVDSITVALRSRSRSAW
jgi:prepilin-type N-terminal cleavage/methylation domain-containing protein